jgi:hypothetical protein
LIAWSSRSPFLAIKADCVLYGEGHEHQAHAYEANGASDIEKPVLPSKQNHDWLPEQRDIADREQDTKLSWAEAPERDAKLSQRVGRKV